MYRLFTILTYGVLATLLGCASLVTDKRDVLVRVTTTPPGATLVALGNEYRSPATLWLPRREGNILLSVSKEGYRSEYIVLEQSDNPQIILNLLNLLLAAPIDIMNGVSADLHPENLHVRLKKKGTR